MICLAALVALTPLMLLTALAIIAGARGGALFRQKRIGHRGMPFDSYKFRRTAVVVLNSRGAF